MAVDPQLVWLCPGAHRWAPRCRHLGTSRRKPGQKTSRSLVHTSSGLTDWEGGEQPAGCRKETAQSKAGGGVSYSRWHKVPRSVPPIKRPFPSLQKNYSCKHPDDRKMGLEQQSNSACPLCSGGDGDVAQCLNTQYRDLLISGEIKYTQHEQSPKWSWARPHTAVFVCGGTGCSSQRHHLSGRFPFQAIEQWGKLKIDRSAELYICFARRYGLAFANRPFSTLGAPGEAGTHGQAPEHEASAGPGQGKSHPLPDLPSHPRTAQREKSEVGSTSAWE